MIKWWGEDKAGDAFQDVDRQEGPSFIPGRQASHDVNTSLGLRFRVYRVESLGIKCRV